MISAIIITKNEEKMIEDCLISVGFADEIIVVDTGNTDSTNEIAKRLGAKIVTSTGTDYAQFRNDGLKAAKKDWIVFVDADERISPLLRKEIEAVTAESPENTAFAIPRQNMFLGKQMKHGGWENDYVVRLFKRQALKRYENPLHEQPVFEGEMKKLENPLIHFSHRDLATMLDKTIGFTKHEAELRIQANHPPMSAWRFVRVMATEFWFRFIKHQAWKDGTEGIIDGMFQVFNTFIIYARLWEFQEMRKYESRTI